MSIRAQRGKPNTSNEASRQGTCGHQISEEVLVNHTDPQIYLGREMLFWENHRLVTSGEDWADRLPLPGADPEIYYPYKVVVDQDLVDAVWMAIEFVRELVEETGGILKCEIKVPIGQFTGEQGATGTADVVILQDGTLIIGDFKFGRKMVTASDIVQHEGEDSFDGTHQPEIRRINLQLACYALGALELFGDLFDITHIRVMIFQPFLRHLDEYTCTVEELREVEAFLRQKAIECDTNPVYEPSAENCFFCRASGDCEAQKNLALETASREFGDSEEPHLELASLYERLPLVRAWCDGVERRMEELLRKGHRITREDGLHYKLIAGNNGRREWIDPQLAEQMVLNALPPIKHDLAYTRKLLSPTQTEALTKRKRGVNIPPVISQEAWDAMQLIIDQRDGKLSPQIVLSTDPRPALPGMDLSGFTDVEDDPIEI